ncbi:MAG: hypothetical protein KY394_06490, partial [Actinobacteria bacterium]|nr:hypothetical protein [Actinomycetota bacterium]
TIHPELPPSDINRAAGWYREKLGLEPVLHGNEPVEPGTTEFHSELLYDTGTARFGVYESWTAGGTRPPRPDWWSRSSTPLSPNSAQAMCGRNT